MAWQTKNEKEEKERFIKEWLKREHPVSQLCHRHGISRKTGYKLITRFIEEGVRAYEERSRARHHHPNKTSAEIESRLLESKTRYPHWGPIKIRDWLLAEAPGVSWPAASTIGDIFQKYGLVKTRKYRKKVRGYNQPFLPIEKVNQVWSADFKGQFRLGNKNYCYPLTATDNLSRYLLMCHGLTGPNILSSRECFERLFIEYGLPDAIRTDNGQPFGGLGLGGLTQLSVWWLELGIRPERIQVGRPEQNGRHERMHRTLKQETALHPAFNMKGQQKLFDAFQQEYNHDRPHAGINKKRPAEIYKKSTRSYADAIGSEVNYPDQYLIRRVRSNGMIKWHGKHIYASELLRKKTVGLEPIDEERAFVYFAQLRLGIIDAREDQIISPD